MHLSLTLFVTSVSKPAPPPQPAHLSCSDSNDWSGKRPPIHGLLAGCGDEQCLNFQRDIQRDTSNLGVTAISWVEARGAARAPAVLRTAQCEQCLGVTCVSCPQPSTVLLEGGACVSWSRGHGCGLCRFPLPCVGAVRAALALCSLNCAAFPARDISAGLRGPIPCTPLGSRWFLYVGLVSSTCIKMKYVAPLRSKLRKRGAWPPHGEEEFVGGRTPLGLLLVSDCPCRSSLLLPKEPAPRLSSSVGTGWLWGWCRHRGRRACPQ